MSDVTDLVDAQIAAYRNRDLERFLGFYAPDVAVKDFDGNVLMDGTESMREQYAQLFRDSPNLTVDISSRTIIGDFVVDEEQIGGFTLPGFPTSFRAVVIYRVKAGKIRDVLFLS
jgi:uncharacterized protein (TIGR02246 family)